MRITVWNENIHESRGVALRLCRRRHQACDLGLDVECRLAPGEEAIVACAEHLADLLLALRASGGRVGRRRRRRAEVVAVARKPALTDVVVHAAAAHEEDDRHHDGEGHGSEHDDRKEALHRHGLLLIGEQSATLAEMD